MPIDIVLYTRPGCHLCEDAKQVIQSARAGGMAFDLHEINIDSDERLRSRYANDVPVILINGREAFRHRLDRKEFGAVLGAENRKDEPMSDLAEKECVPCKGGVPPIKGAGLEELRLRLGGNWRVVDEHHLENEWTFRNFAEALEFTNRIGEIAEAQNHHPDIYLAWGKVKVTIWTHKIDGLTESDFVLAAKIDRIRST